MSDFYWPYLPREPNNMSWSYHLIHWCIIIVIVYNNDTISHKFTISLKLDTGINLSAQWKYSHSFQFHRTNNSVMQLLSFCYSSLKYTLRHDILTHLVCRKIKYIFDDSDWRKLNQLVCNHAECVIYLNTHNLPVKQNLIR